MPDINDGSQPLTYSANDWFYMKNKAGDTCDLSKIEKDSALKTLCSKNKDVVVKLHTSTNELGASVTHYNDAKMLYNRELLFTVNILAGLALLCYYIYLNQSVFPSPSSAIKGVGAIGNSMSNATSSWKTHLAMRPPSPPLPTTTK